MAKGLIEEQTLTDIANAIRSKNGASTQYKPSEMAGAIENIPTGSTSSMAPTSISFDSYKLQTLDLSSLDTSNITDMGSMFSFCTTLSSLDLSKFNTSKVTEMNLMFYFCATLTTLDLSNFDTSEVTNMTSMFERCYSLTTLDISNFDTSKVTKTEGMFTDCGRDAVAPTTVYVKDAAMQQWVLGMSDIPSDWSTSNVIIKEVS